MASMDTADAKRLMAELQETAGELQRELHALAAAAERLTPVTVEDEKRAVKLILAANGAVESLELHEDWRERIPEPTLGAVVTGCYQQALNERTGNFMQGYAEHGESDAAQAVAQVPAPEPVTLGDPSVQWGVEARDQLREAYEAAEAQQQEFIADRAAKARQVRDGVNASKTVVVTRQGETITAVQVDERWVKNTNDGVIEREIVRAMNGVMAMAARERENKFDGFPAIEQLMKLAHSPNEMMRRMGAIR